VIILKIVFYAIGPETSKGVLMYGGTRFWVEMGKRWGKKKENEIHVVGSVGTHNICIREEMKAHFHLAPSLDISASSIKPISFLKLLKQVIKTYFLTIRLSEGIIFSPSHYLWDTFPALGLKKKKERLKLVVVVHNIIPVPTSRKGDFPTNFLAFLMQMISLALVRRHADAIFSISRPIKEYLVRCGFPEKKIFLTNNGVPSKCISQMKVTKRYYDASFMGRLHPTKGISDLIEIWKLITKDDKNAKLAIIGTGSHALVKRFRNRIVESGLERNIVMLGYLRYDEAYRVMKSSRVFIFPSYEESWGISVCEAMACALPVVAYDLPAYKEFGSALIKVPLGDIRTFAKAILTLLLDEKLRSEMAEKTSQVASQFDWEQVAEKNWSILLTKVSKA